MSRKKRKKGKAPEKSQEQKNTSSPQPEEEAQKPIEETPEPTSNSTPEKQESTEKQESLTPTTKTYKPGNQKEKSAVNKPSNGLMIAGIIIIIATLLIVAFKINKTIWDIEDSLSTEIGNVQKSFDGAGEQANQELLNQLTQKMDAMQTNLVDQVNDIKNMASEASNSVIGLATKIDSLHSEMDELKSQQESISGALPTNLDAQFNKLSSEIAQNKQTLDQYTKTQQNLMNTIEETKSAIDQQMGKHQQAFMESIKQTQSELESSNDQLKEYISETEKNFQSIMEQNHSGIVDKISEIQTNLNEMEELGKNLQKTNQQLQKQLNLIQQNTVSENLTPSGDTVEATEETTEEK